MVNIALVDLPKLYINTLTGRCSPGVDFTKGFKTWHKFSTEIRFMLIPIIVLFIAHEFITGNFYITGKHRAMTEHSTKIYL